MADPGAVFWRDLWCAPSGVELSAVGRRPALVCFTFCVLGCMITGRLCSLIRDALLSLHVSTLFCFFLLLLGIYVSLISGFSVGKGR